jgi:hypothetical protein
MMPADRRSALPFCIRTAGQDSPRARADTLEAHKDFMSYLAWDMVRDSTFACARNFPLIFG